VGDPAAVLLIEFFEIPLKSCRRGQRLELICTGRAGLSFPSRVGPAQGRIWKLRQARWGFRCPSLASQGVSFVEDTAVDTSRLRDYIARFLEILKEHDTQAGFYAHASVGLLHVRPVVNLKLADGVRKFARIAEQISDLVLEFGGALSGEHGDGLVRVQQRRCMRRAAQRLSGCRRLRSGESVQSGKIVDPPLTHHLRFGPGYQTNEIVTTFTGDLVASR
jgi:FAD/FMN-containing dehydrogenase